MENYCNFKPFDKVLVRYDDQHVWQIDFFSHYVRGVECPYKCLTRDFNQCIPYNGNEHLIDTTNEPSLPTQSQTQTKENKMEEDCDNYGYPVEYFKRNDVVLCRDAEDEEWTYKHVAERIFNRLTEMPWNEALDTIQVAERVFCKLAAMPIDELIYTILGQKKANQKKHPQE
jgi:hypothetical protein